MTTDDGIDLVAYAPKLKETVQVKTCLKPKPAGGKGRATLDWWMRRDNPAQLVGLVDLETDAVWLFRHQEFAEKAQQNPEGRLHLHFYIGDSHKARAGCHLRDFELFRLEHRIADIFEPTQVSD